MRKLKMLRNLHRTERALWIMLLMCLLLLFKLGIDIEYEHIRTVWVNVVHTITVITSVVTGVFQGIVVNKINEYESEVFNNER